MVIQLEIHIVWKKIPLTKKIFRQINALVKTFSRNFLKICVRVCMYFAHHSVEITEFYCHHFSRKFLERNFLLKNLSSKFLFFNTGKNSTLCGNYENFHFSVCSGQCICSTVHSVEKLSQKKSVKSTLYLVTYLVKLLLSRHL